ncbi:hypothetical protein [Azospirillum halopraeferens]|uniref:hypothetical protein n=1 Tax=Azospirillum halopraeferens TaxID=34010 RepID=UPI00041D9B32|nr:hypothetical protein [Azospirillum halopraeferens]
MTSTDTRTNGQPAPGGTGSDPSDSRSKADRIIGRRFDRAERLLPESLRAWLVHLRQPSASWIRIPVGVLLVIGGLLAFLPGLGIWMLPLGLLLLALDVALLKRPTALMVVSGERRWRRLLRWWNRR